MDGNQLDQIARGVARQAPRRQVLGGLLAGAAALLTGTSASAVKNRTRRGKHKGDGGDADPAIPGTQVGGIWDETIDICHFDAETGEYSIIPVSTPTVPDYLNAGDTLYIDCCADGDCVALPCLTPTGCIQGACAYDSTDGAPCALQDGTTGYCDSDAVCISTVPSDASGTA